MSTRSVAWIANVALLSGALACSGDTTAPVQTVVPLIPLTVGTAYTYHAADTLIGVIPAREEIAPDSDFTVRVVRDLADRSGTRWAGFDLPERMFGPASPAASYFTNASDGLRRISNSFPGGVSVGVSYVIFPYPASPGTISAYGSVLTVADTVITVPAGTFHCLRYDDYNPIPGRPHTMSLFIAPGIGVVQRSVNFTMYNGSAPNEVVGRHDRVYRLTAFSIP
jgi:hypothetical protein